MRKSAVDLIDFPVSWDWWRHYCRYYDGYDPGPNEPVDDDSTHGRVEESEQEVERLKSREASAKFYHAPMTKPGKVPQNSRISRGVEL